MWGGAESELPRQPGSARTHTPVNPHEPPHSMGEGNTDAGYIDYGNNAFSDRQAERDAYHNPPQSSAVPASDSDRLSTRTGSSAPLNVGGAPAGLAGSPSLRSRRTTNRQPSIDGYSDRRGDAASSDHQSSLDQAYAAGMPIGLLAAMGTPYAKKPIFRSKKFKVLCLLIIPITLIIANVLLLLPILRAIAKHALHTSVLHVYTSNITSPADFGFGLTLNGQAKKTGIFPAKLYFRNPVYVFWINPDNMTEVQLGHFPLAELGAAAGHAKINQQSTFTIDNEPAFGRFTEYLITQSEFTWQLRSDQVDASAFSFISANGLKFRKDLTLPGMGNFTDIAILNFQLPGNDPAGGITQDVVTTLYNPSPFGVEIGTLAANLYYKGMFLGPAVTERYINLTQGQNIIPLTGRLIDQTGNQTALDLLGELFSSYLNGDVSPVIAIGDYVQLPDGTRVSWLNQGIRALQLNVPLRCPTGPISPILSITIGTFGLNFDKTGANPYAPIASSNATSAAFGLPFGFSLNISAVQVSMAIVENGTIIANLSTPYGEANTFILDQNAGFESGSLNINVPPSPLIVEDTEVAHLTYSQFQDDFFVQNGSNFYLTGLTSTTTSTPIGEVSLKDIKFVVPAGLIGLSRLTLFPTTIITVDVIDGTPDAIVLSIEVGLTNPSNLILYVGDVTLQLFEAGSSAFLGTTVLPDLYLTVGYQTHTSTGYFQANNNQEALNVLTKFTNGEPSDLLIAGFNGSTPIESLTKVFMDTHLNTTLNGLTVKLLNYANLTILPTTDVTDNIAASIVSLKNPFSATLLITNIQSNITARGLYTGAINQDTEFTAPGNADDISPVLNFGLNTYPPDVFSLTRQLVVDSGMDPTPLDGIVQLGGYQYVPTVPGPSPPQKRKRGFVEDEDGFVWTSGEDEEDEESYQDTLLNPAKGAYTPGGGYREPLYFPEAADNETREAITFEAPVEGQHQLSKRQSAAIYKGFNLPTYILQAFKALTVNVVLTSVLNIGEFSTVLNYTQNDVPAYTDTSLLLLLPILARPIVQKIVDGSILGIDTVLITNPQLNSFGTTLVGSITQAGPFDAVIEFPQGLIIYWDSLELGVIAMPNVSLVGDVGAQLNLQAGFSVSSVDALTNFTEYLLNTPQFTWTIEGSDLTVSALGIVVDQISISKTVVLDGLNGLKNDVVITHFDLPANDPAGGITLTINTTIQNPSTVGVELSALSFQNYFGSTNIGPAEAVSAFTLAPKSMINLNLIGRLIPQTSDQGLQDVSTIFTAFIHGVPAEVIVAGDSAGPPGVTWLNEGIKAISVAVIFPAALNLQIINAITIYQITLIFTEATAWNPAFSTNYTVADFQLPFAFPLNILQTGAQITSVDGQGFALLDVPLSPSITDVVARNTILQFSNVPFAVFDSTHNIFSQFLTDTTDDASKTFGLQGVANTISGTAVGNLNINGIAFSVSTTVAGLQGLNAQPAFVSDLDVYHGYPDYLQINVNAHLFNPSNITIGAGDVQFQLQFEGQIIGSAVITGLLLVPGANVIPTAVRYEPTGGASTDAGQTLLQNFVQSIVSTTNILGTMQTTPIESLQQALATISLVTNIPPLMQNLITQAALVFPTDIVQTGVANSNFNLQNPFTAGINLLGVIATAIYPSGSTPASKRVKRFGGPGSPSINGLNLGQINVPNINPVITAPGHTQITSYFLPLNFNLDPKVIIQLLEAQASKNGVDLGPLPPLFSYVLGLSDSQISALRTQIPTQVLADQTSSGNAPQCVSGGQFDVFDAILNSLKNLDVALEIQSVTKLDDYQTNLNFNQYNVPAITDRTALYLIGAVGPPIVQELVDQSVLTVARADVTDVTDNGFTAALTGSLLDTGPFDAYIIFPNGVDVYFMGTMIANVVLPPICSPANIAVPNLQTTGVLSITDLGAFTNFATYILHNPSFQWLLQTNSLRVQALGVQFDGVALQKTVSFLAFNGLPGVNLFDFDLPGDAPNNAGINIRTQSNIPSPATLGIELGNANFISSFQNNEIGPVSTSGLFLAAQATTVATLTGLFVPQSGDGIRSTGVLFSEFLQGVTQTIQATGDSVITPAQPSRPVNWLSTAFKTLTINVILPGKIYTIISMIQLANIQIEIINQAQAYAVDSSSTEADATYANPFTFSLQAIQAAVDATINFNGVDTAQLNLPLEPSIIAGVSTGQPVPLRIAFQNQTLASLNNPSFQAFFAQVTDTARADFVLHGGANVIAATKIGNIPISGIPFSVNSYLPGINQFGGVGSVPAAPITVGSGGGAAGLNSFDETPGSAFIRLTLNFVINNPSTTTITSNFISFAVMYSGAVVGRATVTNVLIVPGSNTLASEFHYGPQPDTNSGLVTAYLEDSPTITSWSGASTNNIPITVMGDSQSTPYGSLLPALEGVTLQASFPGFGALLVSYIDIFVDFAVAFCQGYTSIEVTVNNSLSADIYINNLDALADQPRGKHYASLTSQSLTATPFPAQATKLSGMISPVRLIAAGENASPQANTVASLPLFGQQGTSGAGLDLTNVIRTTIGQVNGYVIPNLLYRQDHVHYTIHPTIGGINLTDPIQSLSDPVGTLRTFVGVLAGAGASCLANGLGLTTPCSTLTALPVVGPLFQAACPAFQSPTAALCTAIVEVEQIASVVGGILNPLLSDLIGTTLAPSVPTGTVCTATTTVTSTTGTSTTTFNILPAAATALANSVTSIAQGAACTVLGVAGLGGLDGACSTPATTSATSTTSSTTSTTSTSSTSTSTTSDVLPTLLRRAEEAAVFFPFPAARNPAYQTELARPAWAGYQPQKSTEGHAAPTPKPRRDL